MQNSILYTKKGCRVCPLRCRKSVRQNGGKNGLERVRAGSGSALGQVEVLVKVGYPSGLRPLSRVLHVGHPRAAAVVWVVQLGYAF